MKYADLIQTLSLEEKAALMSGKSVWETQDYPKKGIPSIFLSDGPHGIRKQEGEGDHLGLNASIPATCFPTAATLANSWDVNLVEQVGQGLGAEANSLGVNVILGPGLNIKRSPLCGRNFEYYSEDPYQTGKLAAAMIRGIQSQGVAATPKHFAVNSQELRRMASDSVVDERTLREIYLTGFEIAVREGKPQALMSAYNKINGIYANEDKRLLIDLLRDEWGFTGFVVSDWGGSNDHVLGVENGSHLEMPGTKKVGQKEIIDAVKSGRLSEKVLNERVDELLSLVLDLAKTERQSVDYARQHELARKAASESIVLLKNQDDILPLSSDINIALIGDFAKNPRYQGAGSSLINTRQLEKTVDCVKDYPLTIIGYEQGYQRVDKEDKDLLDNAVKLAQKAEVILYYMGLDEMSESEGLDRRHLSLPKNQLDLLEVLVQTGKKVVVVLSAGSVVDMSWDRNVHGILHGYLSGEAGATAMLDALTGRVNPSGKLSETYPVGLTDIPSSANYPAEGEFALYKEALYVGYRYFTSVDKPVKYPFGYGMSYTSFAYDQLEVSEAGAAITVTNIGSVAGAEVVQLYVGKEDSQIYRPTKELKGFNKVYLKAGESKRIFIPFDTYTFRYFNRQTGQFEVEGGSYLLYIGASSSDIRIVGEIIQEGTSENFPISEQLPSYLAVQVEAVSNREFSQLLGRPVPEELWQVGQELGMNDPVLKLQFAKSVLARFVHKVLAGLLKKAERKGTPDLNLLFLYNMPFRAMAKMTGDLLDRAMVEGILMIANGHFFKGLVQLWRAYRTKIKYQKQLS
ncbi:glycoside hydrolase family 3 C-terminal domain-containing protein [Streptococcus ruminantium]|uniref:Glycoside hydrolase family 3 C-terminal domain-containing protein n=1 Tax=Streptococcus ruminantium TaxID=1917441 RepID=A0ABU1B426_9STRE|nr:glycoside hydrolase family 3 C-terminal domain-containing protein [Streptococcus ruminantium]MDQ8759028.1 glycoside hydrolase family 3 C-terminal domain-containing protein [Streptococcus ruminantium]MDQ8765478.1 glycoside hydrolase family 3 C-terminal domain-containing protein [Streptococcus ruminantium]MDQ8768405.1 glycoside hydrolase family 3 C-terminal domain-containing protein [Streptococcus ruminantium]MDQ8775169.1 glycoside hydrolase family 3 C-terminal domain-containing protein [Strep